MRRTGETHIHRRTNTTVDPKGIAPLPSMPIQWEKPHCNRDDRETPETVFQQQIDKKERELFRRVLYRERNRILAMVDVIRSKTAEVEKVPTNPNPSRDLTVRIGSIIGRSVESSGPRHQACHVRGRGKRAFRTQRLPGPHCVARRRDWTQHRLCNEPDG